MVDLYGYWDTIYRPLKLRSASPNTIKLWGIAIRKFGEFLGVPATLEDLTDAKVAAYATWRRADVGAATVNRDLASLLAVWRFASRRGELVGWPTVDLCKEPRRVPVAWTEDEFNRLMVTVRELSGTIGDHPSSWWWTALLLVAFDSGERIGALMGLEWTSVDLHGGWICFSAETRKGQREDSLVPIAPDTKAALHRIKKKSGLVFVWPFGKTYLWGRLGRILEIAGLPNDRRRKFHCVRRTVASHVEAAGGNAQQILRHSHRRTTQSYLDPRIVRQASAIDYLWRPPAE